MSASAPGDSTLVEEYLIYLAVERGASLNTLEAYSESYLDDIRARSRDRKLPAGFDEKAWREENRASAVWQAKWVLLRNRIAEAEGITVTDEDLGALAAAEAGRTSIPQERLLEYYKQSGGVGEKILGDKLMAFLRAAANITEREIKAPAES